MEKRIYGSTGEVGKDGILTPDQQLALNRLQEKAASSSIQYLDQINEGDPYPMVAMATGIGKGNIIHRVLERQMRRKPDSKVLLVAGTKVVLVKQTHEALSQYQQTEDNNFDYVESEDDDDIIEDTTSIDSDPLEDEQSFFYKTGKFGQKDANVHVATIQTVQSETKKKSFTPEDYDLVIVDEVHNLGTKSRKETIQQFKKVVGFTATPYRHSGRLKAPDQYGFTVIESLPLPEAQELRLLPPLVGIQIDTKDVVDEIPTTKTGAIDFKALEKILKESPDLRPYIADRVAKIMSNEGRNYKTVVAVNFVWEAQEIAELLKEKGIKVGVAVNQQAAKEIHTDEIPAIDTIERYKLPEDDEQSIQVLISPYVASEGFDAPFTEVLVWASPTDSAVRYTQYTGRLARRAEGKLFGVVVDCLYQTNQYSWSYNMGMWMKGHVQQLENGMLWLGPETDIENLKKLPQIEDLRKTSDSKSLIDLQRVSGGEIQPTDFPITQSYFNETFRGKYERVRKIADDILTQLRDENPELIQNRITSGNLIVVVTDREKFIQLMLAKGIELMPKDIENLQETDFPITSGTLREAFLAGATSRVAVAAREVLKQLQETNPDIVKKRKTINGVVTVVTDKNAFASAMLALGIEAKKVRTSDYDGLKEGEFALTATSLNATFSGGDQKLRPISIEVMNELAREDTNIVQERRSGKAVVKVVTDRERFIREMLKRGAKLKTTGAPEIQDSDFIVSANSLLSMFRGDYYLIREMADEVLRDYSTSDLIQKRKNGKSISTVFSKRELFIEEMQKRGAKLKN